MIKKTVWRPDTCGCEIEYEWDDSVDQSVRTHTVSNINKVCDVHKGLSISQHYDAIVEENTSKNKAIKAITDTVITATEEVLLDSGKIIKRLKTDKKINWSFDIDRKLVIDTVGFTDSEKSEVTAIVTDLAVKKAVIE